MYHFNLTSGNEQNCKNFDSNQIKYNPKINTVMTQNESVIVPSRETDVLAQLPLWSVDRIVDSDHIKPKH